MYEKACARRALSVERKSEDRTPSGVRAATLTIEAGGDAEWESETGVHRVVRVPKARAARGRRQTSFASVRVERVRRRAEATPPRREDLRFQFERGRGPGGQNRNKRDTAVRVVDTRTGRTARAERERTQGANRRAALAALEAGEARDAERGRARETKEAWRNAPRAEFGSQVRSYRLDEDTVIDHRSGRRARAARVLGGELERLWAGQGRQG